MRFDARENGTDRSGGGNVFTHKASPTDAMTVLRRQHPTSRSHSRPPRGCTSSANGAAHLHAPLRRPDRGHRLIVLGATCVAHSDLVSDATGRALSGRQVTLSRPRAAKMSDATRRDEKGAALSRQFWKGGCSEKIRITIAITRKIKKNKTHIFTYIHIYNYTIIYIYTFPRGFQKVPKGFPRASQGLPTGFLQFPET